MKRNLKTYTCLLLLLLLLAAGCCQTVNRS